MFLQLYTVLVMVSGRSGTALEPSFRNLQPLVDWVRCADRRSSCFAHMSEGGRHRGPPAQSTPRGSGGVGAATDSRQLLDKLSMQFPSWRRLMVT